MSGAPVCGIILNAPENSFWIQNKGSWARVSKKALGLFPIQRSAQMEVPGVTISGT
jgi:hypothetical protein